MESHTATRVSLVMPELGVHGIPVFVSLWLVPQGAAVMAGDRVVELVAGGVTVDLEAPCTGRLVAQHVDEDERVVPGMILAECEATA